ncbi:MAG: winged helix-turn-helix domain-containing protein, partial [Lacisediminihabitans sp.]
MIRVGSWEFYPESRTIYSPYDGRVLLTKRENALLRMLAENPRQTFTRSQILRTAFNKDDQPGTVDTYVHYLRRKTDIDLVLTVRGQGYRLGDI